MTRPNYSINIPGSTLAVEQYPVGSQIQTDYFNYTSSNALHSEETSSGVSRRKPKGWIPPTGYTLLHKQHKIAVGSCSQIYKPDPRYRSVRSGVVGFVGGFFNSLGHFDAVCVDTYEPAGLENRSLIAARNKLKNSKVNLGNAFGERAQLAHQLGDTATRLAKSVRQLRHANWRGAMQTLGLSTKKGKPRGSNWTDHWLALQYGWKPLLSDIHGAADALTKRPKSDWIVTAKGYATQKESFQVIGAVTDPGTFTCQVFTSAMTRIDCQPQNEATISLVSLGILNPLEVAWEVTPFSFVVDWFLPIGDWLDSMDAMLGYTSAYSSTSFLQKMKWLEVGASSSNAYTIYTYSYTGSKSQTKVRRSASSGVPIPVMPTLKDGRSLGHMANGLALLSQAFGRTPRSAKSILGRNPGRPFIARYGTV